MGFKLLVSVTCVAILGALAWWGWQQYSLARQHSEQAAFESCITDKMQSIAGMKRDLAGLACVFAGDAD